MSACSGAAGVPTILTGNTKRISAISSLGAQPNYSDFAALPLKFAMDPTGRAFAAFTTTGSLVMSVALNGDFMRITRYDGSSTVISLSHQIQSGWNALTDASSVATVILDGTPSVVTATPNATGPVLVASQPSASSLLVTTANDSESLGGVCDLSDPASCAAFVQRITAGQRYWHGDDSFLQTPVMGDSMTGWGTSSNLPTTLLPAFGGFHVASEPPITGPPQMLAKYVNCVINAIFLAILLDILIDETLIATAACLGFVVPICLAALAAVAVASYAFTMQLTNTILACAP